TVDDKVFDMQAKLGFLFKSFLPLIEKTVNQNLDNALQAVKDR
ncbi:polyhydroxyalkanoic acid system family protein, partial [Mycobacterium tuberculosis]|nr:polyhydroxyalkanoic acid system family protein [Mycobacterium tuberculosis]